MNQTSTEEHPLLGVDGRARALRLFLIALVGTPGIFFMEPARQIVSLEATIAAIGLGVFLGIIATIGLADVDLRDVNNVTATVITLVWICVATIAVWLIVPRQYLGTMLQFVLAFTWTMPVMQLLYHRYRVPAPG